MGTQACGPEWSLHVSENTYQTGVGKAKKVRANSELTFAACSHTPVDTCVFSFSPWEVISQWVNDICCLTRALRWPGVRSAAAVSSWVQWFLAAAPQDVQGCVGRTSVTGAHVPHRFWGGGSQGQWRYSVSRTWLLVCHQGRCRLFC